MPILFNRKATVNIDGREFTSPPFSIEFEMEFKESGIGSAKVRLYNPAPETVDSCKPSKKKKALVEISAGYSNDSGKVYLGEIVEVKETFKRPDRILEIDLVDVSAKWKSFPINQTFVKLPASGILSSICGMANVELAKSNLGTDPIIPKLYISTFEYGVAELAKQTNSRYFIKYGSLYFDTIEKQIEEGFDLNYQTGLIGSPELVVKNDKKKGTTERYKIRTLFLYKIQNGSTIRVSSGANQKIVVYKVLSGKHSFSTFGNAFSEIEAAVINGL